MFKHLHWILSKPYITLYGPVRKWLIFHCLMTPIIASCRSKLYQMVFIHCCTLPVQIIVAHSQKFCSASRDLCLSHASDVCVYLLVLVYLWCSAQSMWTMKCPDHSESCRLAVLSLSRPTRDLTTPPTVQCRFCSRAAGLYKLSCVRVGCCPLAKNIPHTVLCCSVKGTLESTFTLQRY